MQHWNKRNEMERELDLARIGRILLKRAWLIVAVALVASLVVFIWSAAFVTPQYQSYFTAYVNNRVTTDEEGKTVTVNTSTGDMTASMGLVYVYQDIITSRSVLSEAAKACGTTYSEIAGSVQAVVSATAPVITVVVETPDKDLSLHLAEKIAELAPKKVEEVVLSSSMRIIDHPVKAGKQSSPNNLRNAAIGAIAGLVVMALGCIALDIIHDNVQDDADLERRYSVPVIGHIPDMLLAEKNGERYGYRKVERK